MVTRQEHQDKRTIRNLWDASIGGELFDVLSSQRVHSGICFDNTFYQDQKSKRTLRMITTTVTQEYIEQERQRKIRESRSQARISSAFYYDEITAHLEVDGEVEPASESELDVNTIDGESVLSFGSTFSCPLNVTTRSHVDPPISESIHVKYAATQTVHDDFITVTNVPVRILSERAQVNERHVVEPRYMEAISLLMSENMSAAEAIKAIHVVDTVIWRQTRHLPLELDKGYKWATATLAKLQNVESTTETSLMSIMNLPQDTDPTDVDYYDECVTETNDLSLSSTCPAEILKLQAIVKKKRDERKSDPGNVLPSLRCARENHKLVSVYCETKIASELVSKQGYIMPDGTSRQGVGDIAGSVIKVGDKIRALKSVQITKGSRKNWSAAIIHLLKRLAVASNNEVDSVWRSVTAVLSDLCKVNKHLAAEIQAMIGSEWKPGQVFCNLHFTLAVPEAIKSVLGQYQSRIGAEKLFPKTVGFEMELEDQLIVVQILDCWMRLTSIRWQARAWNKYKHFTDFAEKRGIRNVGHMLHANRFGEFEERCAGGLYLAKVWTEWLETFSDVRNQLACYLREVMPLIDQCQFYGQVLV